VFPDNGRSVMTGDIYPFGAQGLVAANHNAIDPQSEDPMNLEELGCKDEITARPAEPDLCGNLTCGTLPDGTQITMAKEDGTCASGVPIAGCCFPRATGGDTGSAQVLSTAGSVRWQDAPAGEMPAKLGAKGAFNGDPAEFLWFADPGVPVTGGATDFDTLAESMKSQTLDSGGQMVDSNRGVQGNFTVFETLVKLPNTDALKDKVVQLVVSGMDDGLRVQVDGRLVRYVTGAEVQQGPVTIRVVSTAVPSPTNDGVHVIRLTHLNDQGDSNPLIVTLQLAKESSSPRADGGGAESEDAGEGGSCSLVAHAASVAPLGILVLFLAAIGSLELRRRRAAARSRGRQS
jgi:hypothetical protein